MGREGVRWGGLADWLRNDERGFPFEEMKRGWLGGEEGRMLEFVGWDREVR